MADLMISSPMMMTGTTTTPSSSVDGGGAIIMDAQTVTPHHHHQHQQQHQTSPILMSSSNSASCTGGGGSTSSSPAMNGTTIKIPHPQNNNSNGQQMSEIASCTSPKTSNNTNSSHNYNNSAHHHHHLHNHHNNNVTPSLTTTTTTGGSVTTTSSTSTSSGSGGLLQHNRNHSYPLLFTSNSGANTNNSNHVESSSSSVAPEMAMANNGGGGVVTALPSSTTMDILNLDFVNGNSSYCHNSGNGRANITSPLSCWPPSSSSHLKAEQLAPTTNVDQHHHHHHQYHSPSAVTLTNNNNNSSTTEDSTTLIGSSSSNNSGKIPGEIPDSVMKYLLTKTDSVDSTKSAHSSSGSSPSSNNSSSSPNNNALSPLSEHHHHNKRLQEFLVDLDTLQSTTEIAKVLENFNAILERIEQEDDKEALEGLEALTTPLSPTVLNCPTATVSSTSRIKNSVEILTDLLLSGCGEEEDEDLLIIIDENESESLHSANCISNGMDVSLRIEEDPQGEDDELEDDVSSLVEIEGDLGDLDQEEGYESDRPIVRASMRKLRPVKLLPMPSSSNHRSNNYNSNSVHSNNNNNSGINASNAFATPPPTPVTPRASSPVDPNVGLATTLNSPIANKIIVASLINSLNSSAAAQENAQRTAAAAAAAGESGLILGQSSAATCSSSVNGNCSFVPTLDVLHVASGSSGGPGNNSQSQGHARSQSSSSQTIQFHQNPVTISTNPGGFVEVNIGNGGASGGGQGAGSSNPTYDVGSSVEGASSRGALNPTASNPSGGGAAGSSPATGASSSSQARNGVNGSPTAGATNSINSSGNRTTSTTPSNSTASASSTGTTSSTNNNNNNNGSRARPRAPQAPTAGRNTVPPVLRVPAGRWPHRLSSVLAVVGCTLGLNNICRFSLLSVQYGANFIIQFIILSFVFGIPLLTFHMSIGQYLSSGIIDMWKISPIFQGIGVGLVISQAMIGIYTTVGVSWIFIYFRDSFITRQDQYRWGKCVREFGDCDAQNLGYGNSTTHLYNETVPDYFNAVVLQRASPAYPESAYVPSSLKFTVAFNLAVVWMLVFVSLSKGLKSYGKVVHGFVLAPVTALFVLAFKMVNLVQAGGSLFGQTQWSNFFYSSQTWVAAARETFFTWGLLGACVMQITAHNRHSHSLKSDSVIVIMITLIVLMLSAFIGNACHSILTAPNSILSQAQFSYVPSSFESKATYRFLEEIQNSDDPPPDMYDHHHISFLMGVRVIKQGSDFHQRSGYQVLRLATELFPATMAVLSQTGMSSFWTVLFYFAFVLFGVAQQIAIWHCVIKGIIAVKGKLLRSWETTITFFVCGLGFVLGLPLCTETGIFIQYFMDYAIGSGWWIMVLYLLELIAVFIVRGAPYCGENIVTVLITGRNRLSSFLAPLISFIWNVIMPVAILVLAIASFKNGNIRELYDWNPKHGYRFWPSWTREVGSLIQLVPILAVPFVAILQSCRYLSSGPPDLFDRMQQLYRPNSQGLFGNNLSGSFNDNATNSSSSRNGSNSRGTEDPPPKYTPPPSYSTATGAKIAKFLRNSFRRSLRRLSSPGGPSTSSSSPDNLPPPPNYASVILEINSQRTHPSSSCPSTTSNGTSNLLNPIMVPPPTYDESTMAGPPLNSAAKYINKNGESSEAVGPTKMYQIQLSQTLGRSLAEGASKERASLRRIASDITSRDIARMLRQSLRRANRDSPEASTSSAAITSTTIVQAHMPPPSASGASAYSSNSSPSQGIVLSVPTSSSLVDGSSITPCDYTFGPNSLEKVEHDLEMLHDFRHSPDNYHLPSTSSGAAGHSNNLIHSRQSSSSSASQVPINTFGFNFGFNRARNRNSNDSQLALITSGCYEDLSVTSGSLMGALVDGEIEIDNFTQLNLPRRDSLSQLNVLDLGHNGNANPTFRIHNANLPSASSASGSQPPQGNERSGDSEA